MNGVVPKMFGFLIKDVTAINILLNDRFMESNTNMIYRMLYKY